MKIYSLKRRTIPKIAVLVTGLTAAVLVATINPMPAQAFPTKAANCSNCHAAGGSTTAVASTLTPAAGATYTVAITLAANPAGGNSGYAIVPVAPAVEKTNGGNTSAALSYTATMTAPVANGTYTYNVYTNQGLTDPEGQASSASYSITVAAVVTVPPTTVPPTTVPPTTVPPTTVPPTTIPPTTVPPTTIPPTTVPPTTIPPTTIPPVTTAARITSMSPKHGAIGTTVTIEGSGFGDLGSVQFGTVVATAKSWTDTKIVFDVPAGTFAKVAHVSVISGDAASNAVSFRFDKGQRSHHSFGDHHSHRGMDHRAFCGGDND